MTERLDLRDPQLVTEREGQGCARCGGTSCGCYGADPRWERWIKFYSKQWGTTRAETQHEMVNMQLRGHSAGWMDWDMRHEPQRILEPLWPEEAFWTPGREDK